MRSSAVWPTKQKNKTKRSAVAMIRDASNPRLRTKIAIATCASHTQPLRGVMWRSEVAAIPIITSMMAAPAKQIIHCESEAPSDVSVRRRQQCGSDPNNRRCDKPSDTTNNNRPSGGQSNDSRVLQSENCANSAIGRAKSRRVPAANRPGRVRRHYCDEKYLRHNESALDHVIDGKLCGEVCVAEPGEKKQSQEKSV